MVRQAIVGQAIVGSVLLCALVTPALANEFWILQDPANSKCSVAESNPGDTAPKPANAISRAYSSRAEAEDAMSRMRKCGTAE